MAYSIIRMIKGGKTVPFSIFRTSKGSYNYGFVKGSELTADSFFRTGSGQRNFLGYCVKLNLSQVTPYM